MMTDDPSNRIRKYLTLLYGETIAREVIPRLQGIIGAFKETPRPVSSVLSGGQDAFLITYGDQFKSSGEAPLRTLTTFANRHLNGVINGIHILPFFPSTSDDGFSVSDYTSVDSSLGTWDDIEKLAGNFCLMVDAVINHCSTRHPWFQEYLRGNPRFSGYFIEVPPGTDLSRVVRPRTLPLTTCFKTASGEKNLWTTFSADQVDLNYKNPEVLLDILSILLEYIRHGAQVIRLDAIAYLWKEPGTTCIHLPQTHWIIRLIRAVLDEITPSVRLVTETNVPHGENLSYFGDGTNEAHMVYNFTLPPLVLYSIQRQTARELTRWASTALKLPSTRVSFFNFLASHDGIGLNPVRGILSDAQITGLVDLTLQLGGEVSYKNNPDGSKSPYELNINYLDALGVAGGGGTPQELVQRFIVAHAVMLALPGIPGIYVHSLLGSRGWPEGVAQTGQKRAINRQKFQTAEVLAEIEDPRSIRSQVFAALRTLLQARSASPAFHPAGSFRVLDLGDQVFCLLRSAPDHRQTILCVHNLSSREAILRLPKDLTSPRLRFYDRINPQHEILTLPSIRLICSPYQVLWLELKKE